MKTKFLPLALAISMFASVGAGYAKSPSPTSPAKIVLLTKDVPGGHFSLVNEKHTTAKSDLSQQGLSAAHLRKDGYLSGYETQLQYKGSNSNAVLKKIVGAFYVDDAVSSFKTTAGAKDAFHLALGSIAKQKTFKLYKPKSFGSFGDETHGYVYRGSYSTVSLTVNLLVFRHHGYTVYLAASSPTKTESSLNKQFVNFAKLIDSRITSS